MAKKGKKEEKHYDLLEKPEVLAEKLSATEQFIEKNQTSILAIFGILALVIGGWFLYKYYLDSQNEQAQDEMFQAIYYFEQDSLDLALRGDGNSYGFLEIIDEYGNTKAGNLANFYAAAIYMKKGSYSSAIPFLEDFKTDDFLLQARAYSMLGDVYMEEGDFARAAEYYDKAANHKPTKQFTPNYLLKAALAYELDGRQEKAIEKYEVIINDYQTTPEYNKARKYKAMLETKMGS